MFEGGKKRLREKENWASNKSFENLVNRRNIRIQKLKVEDN